MHGPPSARRTRHGERARPVGPFELQDGQQFVDPALPHQLPADACRGRQPGQGRVARPVDERARVRHERGTVRGAAHRQTFQEVHEVVAQARDVVAQPLAGAAVREERADLFAGGDPVPHAPHVRAPPGDRALPDPPVVDVLVQHVHRPGEVVRRDHHRGVLVEPAHREGEGVPVPEGAPEHLVPRDAVREEPGVAGDVGAEAVAGQPAVLPGLLPFLPGEPPHVARHQVGTRRLQGRQHPCVRVTDEDVVAVGEREVRDAGGGAGDPRVPGGAEPRVGLVDAAEAVVPGGELLGDPAAPVGRAVVDHHYLDGVEGLPGQRVETLRQVVLDVVHGDDDAEEWLHVRINPGERRGSRG